MYRACFHDDLKSAQSFDAHAVYPHSTSSHKAAKPEVKDEVKKSNTKTKLYSRLILFKMFHSFFLFFFLVQSYIL